MQPKFRKSSYSGEGGQCVEVADSSVGVVVRDSKMPDGSTVVIPAREFAAFLRELRRSMHV